MVEHNQTISNSFFESFWATADDDEVRPEVRKYYLNFFESNEKLEAEVISYDIREEEDTKKKYAVYNIKVTIDHYSYIIPKRFSEFDELRKIIKDKYQELDFSQVAFPPKTYFSFGGTSIETIEKRKNGFNEFLRFLIAHCKSPCITEFLEFLQVRARTEFALSTQTSFSENTYINHSQEVTKLLEFLDLLNKSPDDSSKILTEMERFCVTARPRVSLNIVKALLAGKYKSQGLVHFCGRIDPETNSHIVCSVGLKFLQTLMDHQACQDAEQFVLAFGSLDPNTISLLNLSEHIEGKAQRQCKGSALKLVDIYLSRNPKLSANDILQPAALQEYEKWKLTKKTTSLTSEGYKISERIDEIKETPSEFSLSPQNSSMNSLDEFSAASDKTFSVRKLNWSELYRDENIKIKYNQGKYLSISLKASSNLDTCFKEFSKGIDFRILFEDTKVIKELDYDTNLQSVKVKFNALPWKHLVFISERRLEEQNSDQIVILERPTKNFPIMLSNTELQAKRFANIVMKQVDNKKVKIKMLIKNADDGAKALQDYLLKEQGGRFILEGCKRFLEDVQKTSN